jgi:hypothetical protein
VVDGLVPPCAIWARDRHVGPAERLTFLLHDMFGVPFDEIATIVGRSPTATRQLANRARRRVQSPGVDAHGAAATARTDLRGEPAR